MKQQSSQQGSSAFKQIADELKLQAWLAGAEFRNPSSQHEDTRNEVAALARLRDELRLQIHLGQLDAADEWERLEGRWSQVKVVAAAVAEEVGKEIDGLLRDIRESYKRLAQDSNRS